MKKFLLLLTFFGAFCFSDLLAAPPSYIQTDASTPAKEKAAAERQLTVYTKEAFALKLNKPPAFTRITTGVVSFSNYSGNRILNEKPTGGRSFQSATFNHTRNHHLPPTFQTTISQTGEKISLLMQPAFESMEGLMTCKQKTKPFTLNKINLFSLTQNGHLLTKRLLYAKN